MNEQSEKEIKKTIPFSVASKMNKVVRNKFNQGGERLLHQKLQNIVKRNEKRKERK